VVLFYPLTLALPGLPHETQTVKAPKFYALRTSVVHPSLPPNEERRTKTTPGNNVGTASLVRAAAATTGTRTCFIKNRLCQESFASLFLPIRSYAQTQVPPTTNTRLFCSCSYLLASSPAAPPILNPTPVQVGRWCQGNSSI
jgi:hypothetical protein